MPICIKCNAVQAKMNKGQLCKKCFNIKINAVPMEHTSIEEISECKSIEDKSIIDLIKEHV